MEENPNVADSQTQEQLQHQQPQDVPLPDPTLVSLVSGLAAQAMVSMGIFPNPVSGQVGFMLHQAKHLVETIAMLDEKTRGNQTAEEIKTISHVLHELRMIYVAAQDEQKRRNGEKLNDSPESET